MISVWSISEWVLHGQTPLKSSLCLFLKDLIHVLDVAQFRSVSGVAITCNMNVVFTGWCVLGQVFSYVRLGCNDSLDCFTPCMWKPDGEKPFRCVGKHARTQNRLFWIDMTCRSDSVTDVLILIISQKIFFVGMPQNVFYFSLTFIICALYGAFQCKMFHYIVSCVSVCCWVVYHVAIWFLGGCLLTKVQ